MKNLKGQVVFGVIAWAITMAVLFLAFSWYSWSMNPGDWPPGARGLYGGVAFAYSMTMGFVLIEKLNPL